MFRAANRICRVPNHLSEADLALLPVAAWFCSDGNWLLVYLGNTRGIIDMNDENRKAQQDPTKNNLFYQNGKSTLIKQPNKSVRISRTQNLVLSERHTALSSSSTTLLETDRHASLLRAHGVSCIHSHLYTAYGYAATQPSAYSATGYNGERIDDSNIYLLGNGYRAFNPILRRFQAPDSSSPFGEGGIHAYAYCSGDPINFTDPTGHVNVKLYIARASASASDRMSKPGLTYDQVSIISKPRNSPPSNNTQYISEFQDNPFIELSRKQLNYLESGLDRVTERANNRWPSVSETEQKLEAFQYLSEQKGLINAAKAYGNREGRIVVKSPKDVATLFSKN